jgi:peptidoglycan hydrolase CwlO-like protein
VSVPAVIIAAPAAGSRPAPLAEATQVRNASQPASYTDADLARVRNEAELSPEARASGSPPPSRSPAPEDGEKRLRERREAVRAAQQRVDRAQSAVDDIRREARENDDDGLQEELSTALSELKSAEKDLARARRRLQELQDQARPVLPPQ